MERRLGTLGEQLTDVVGAGGGGDHVAVVVAAPKAAGTDTPVELDLHLRGTLRRVFADPGMVHRLGPHRFLVLAHRHPGLALTVTTLAQELASDPRTVGADVRITCQALPTWVADIPGFVEHVGAGPVDAPPGGAGLDTRALHSETPRPAGCGNGVTGVGRIRWMAAVACTAVATLVGGAGLVGSSGLTSLQRHADPSAIGATSTTPGGPGPVAGRAFGEQDTRTPDDRELAASGLERTENDGQDEDDDDAVRLVPSGATSATVASTDSTTTTVVGAAPSTEQAVAAVVVVVGMELSSGLALVPSDLTVTAVFLGVPDPEEVPEGRLVVALDGATPGDLCALLALHEDVAVVAGEPACGESGADPLALPTA